MMKRTMGTIILMMFVFHAQALYAQQEKTDLSTMTKRQVLETFVSQLDPQRSQSDKMSVGFVFTEPNEVYQINIFFGKATFSEGLPSDPDLIFTFSESAWEKILSGEVSVWDSVVAAPDESSEVQLSGKTPDFERFLTLFNKDPDTPTKRF